MENNNRTREREPLVGDELLRRLRGEYRIPITDGLGPAGGEEPDNPGEFVRKFETPPIHHDAADEIERLRGANARLVVALDAAADALDEAFGHIDLPAPCRAAAIAANVARAAAKAAPPSAGPEPLTDFAAVNHEIEFYATLGHSSPAHAAIHALFKQYRDALPDRQGDQQR